MEKERVMCDEILLKGLSLRTNNKNEIHTDTAKIATLANTYWSKKIANGFQHRVNPGKTFAVYTNYESDEHGDYTYFIGEEVRQIDNDDRYQTLIIAPSMYQKFTTGTGAIPEIVIASWQKIWNMTALDIEGKRRYMADFEIYDERTSDVNNATVDIYIGIE